MISRMTTSDMRAEEDRLDMHDNQPTELDASDQFFDAWWTEYRSTLRANTSLYRIAADAWRMGWLARSARIEPVVHANVALVMYCFGSAGFGVIATILAFAIFGK